MSFVEIKTAQEFEQALESETKPSVFKAGATWCRPCKMLDNKTTKAGRGLELIVQKYGEQVNFYKYDIDKFAPFADLLQVKGIPAFAFRFPVGKVTDKETNKPSTEPVYATKSTSSPVAIEKFLVKCLASLA